MTNTELAVTIFAAVAGGLAGSFFTYLWSRKTDSLKDKKNVFATLMAFRGVGAAEPDWIKALNIVDVVFYDNKLIRQKVHEYNQATYPHVFKSGLHGMILADLLHAMAKDIGYHNLSKQDILDFYFPEAIRDHYGIPEADPTQQ